MSIIDKERAAQYTRTTVEDADGKKRRVVDNNDAVAQRLRGKDYDELARIARDEGLGDRWDEWEANPAMNRGQVSMALRNALRQRLRAAEKEKAAA